MFLTLTDLGDNILSIAGNNNIASVGLQKLHLRILTDIASEGSDPTQFFNGGYFNLDISQSSVLADLGTSGLSIFDATFGGTIDGTRQDAIYGDSTRAGTDTRHSKVKGGYYEFQFDIYNPLQGLTSLVKHLFTEVIGGHLTSNCLDPAWRTL